MQEFESAIRELDLSLFSRIESQSTESDRRSLLAVQSALRNLRTKYVYLEVGSYLGGSIQPHLLDARCERIFSIDKRPKVQSDARGFDWHYLNNSTQRMIENLRAIDPDAVGKIVTIDGTTSEIDQKLITDPVQLCLIDGEHTDEAMKADFQFCRRMLDKTGGAIVFHDAQITYNGIFDCIQDLIADGVDFRAYALPSVLFVVEFGDMKLHEHPEIRKRLINNHEAYLFGLRINDRYRRFANRFPFRQLRNVYIRLRKGNVSY
ncbi:MAG: class I SAM-dependent methyltransferase [Pyrinomonadaceae bacterium]